VILISDLPVGCSKVKSTLSEQIQPKSQTSNMPQFLENLFTRTADNHVQVISAKTKKMILGPLSNIPLLTTSSGTIERVSSFKLLGVHVDSSFCWSIHFNSIVKKLLLDSTFPNS